MAWLCAALVLVIVGLSAFIRLSQSGLGCEPGPQCRAGSVQAVGDAGQEPRAGVPAARLGHRVVASATLLLVLAMTGLALASGAALRSEARLALALLGLALFLAVLGRWGGQSRLPAVTLGNLLGGFAMFALSVRLALTAGRTGATDVQGAPTPWLGVATALAWVQVALGGLVSAGQAGLSCPALGACDWRAGSWQALNPWALPAADLLPTHAAGSVVHLLHRWSGLALALVLARLAWQAWRQGRRAVAAWLFALPLLLVALGLAQVWLQLPLALVLAHNAASALLLAVLLGMGRLQPGLAGLR
ncbi:MAG: COX15/CtaA family protein [Comamonadaceae bacterium]|nr:COX15/CtaA family protein [Comamonadaceae bacterium]